MFPTAFEQENAILDPAEGTQAHVGSLSVWVGNMDGHIPVVISCWKVTPQELAEINRTGRVWAILMTDGPPQPVLLAGLNPFVREDEQPDEQSKD